MKTHLPILLALALSLAGRPAVGQDVGDYGREFDALVDEYVAAAARGDVGAKRAIHARLVALQEPVAPPAAEAGPIAPEPVVPLDRCEAIEILEEAMIGQPERLRARPDALDQAVDHERTEILRQALEGGDADLALEVLGRAESPYQIDDDLYRAGGLPRVLGLLSRTGRAGDLVDLLASRGEDGLEILRSGLRQAAEASARLEAKRILAARALALHQAASGESSRFSNLLVDEDEVRRKAELARRLERAAHDVEKTAITSIASLVTGFLATSLSATAGFGTLGKTLIAMEGQVAGAAIGMGATAALTGDAEADLSALVPIPSLKGIPIRSIVRRGGRLVRLLDEIEAMEETFRGSMIEAIEEDLGRIASPTAADLVRIGPDGTDDVRRRIQEQVFAEARRAVDDPDARRIAQFRVLRDFWSGIAGATVPFQEGLAREIAGLEFELGLD